jgi:hypothetical protein
MASPPPPKRLRTSTTATTAITRTTSGSSVSAAAPSCEDGHLLEVAFRHARDVFWVPIVASGLLVKDVATVLRTVFTLPASDSVVVCDPVTDEPMRGGACVRPGDAIRVFRTHMPPAPGLHFVVHCPPWEATQPAQPSQPAANNTCEVLTGAAPVPERGLCVEDGVDVVAELTLDVFAASPWVGLCAGRSVVHLAGAGAPVVATVYIPLVGRASTLAELEVAGFAAALAALPAAANVVIVRSPSTLLWNVLRAPGAFCVDGDLDAGTDASTDVGADVGVRLSDAVRALMQLVHARKRVTLSWCADTAEFRRAALRRFRRKGR